jgi:prepilin-type N-terminal cleavage/methylation domain-containing protein
MNKSRKGFTLVELLIVVAILSIMSGVVTQMWIGMERMSSAVRKNMQFSFQGRRILDQFRSDIMQSTQVTHPPDTLIKLTQDMENGNKRQLIYRMDGRELVRDTVIGSEMVRSIKIASLSKLMLDVAFKDNGVVRIELKRKPRKLPMQFRDCRMTTYVSALGDQL